MTAHKPTAAYPTPTRARLAAIHPGRPLRWHDYAEAWLRFPLGKVLDYGCGRGEFLRRIANRSDECWGVDIDANVLADASRITGVRTRHIAAGQPLPFPDAKFETVVIMEVIEHVTDERAVLRECARVLVPEGKLLVSTPHKGALTFLDPGNFKFVAPRLHRFIHCTILRQRVYYEDRFGRTRRSEKDMIANYTLDRPPWHRHYSYEQIRALTPAELKTVAWAVYFPAFRALWTLRTVLTVLTFGRVQTLPLPLHWLNDRLSRTPSRWGDQLIILFQKSS